MALYFLSDSEHNPVFEARVVTFNAPDGVEEWDTWGRHQKAGTLQH